MQAATLSVPPKGTSSGAGGAAQTPIRPERGGPGAAKRRRAQPRGQGTRVRRKRPASPRCGAPPGRHTFAACTAHPSGERRSRRARRWEEGGNPSTAHGPLLGAPPAIGGGAGRIIDIALAGSGAAGSLGHPGGARGETGVRGSSRTLPAPRRLPRREDMRTAPGEDPQLTPPRAPRLSTGLATRPRHCRRGPGSMPPPEWR